MCIDPSLGSGLIKAGFAGDDAPRVVFPTVLGRGSGTTDVSVGEDALSKRSTLDLSHPVKNGIITNWEDMERIWAHTFSELRVSAEDHPILMSESALNSKQSRERMTQILFEGFNALSLFVQSQAVLSLYSSGRTSGIVVDSGDDVTDIVPVHEGYPLQACVERLDIGGQQLTDYMMSLLKQRGYSFHTSSDRDVARDIKEKLCFVSENYETDSSAASQSNIEKSYEMPDGSVIHVGQERFQCAEALFKPTMVGVELDGIADITYLSMMHCDADIRKDLCSNVVLAGGSTMFPGMPERMQHDLLCIAPASLKVRITMQTCLLIAIGKSTGCSGAQV